ncbi:MAG TPA: FG-GAP-like repeat-containing protein [Thermomicrobiales bacterium]|nr:FG-GAP-like repeat-containing protein [Thermomicrobiales bacterium]
MTTHSGPAGTSVTVLGQNFSGAAGHLQVLFGNTPSASVNVFDDGHIVAVAPPGSGTVNIRVQSGVTAGSNSQNIMSPIFGYGTSAVATGGQFTYGTAPPPPATVIAVGADAGGGPDVRLFDAANGTPLATFLAYAPAFHGGVRVAMGDVTGDGIADIVTAPGPGGGPDIRVWDGVTHSLIREFLAYGASFTGGVYVALGDIDGDRHADIFTSPDAGGGPHVEVFSGFNGALLRSFLAYAPNFTGGVRIAAGDVNGDGKADIITAPGAGGGPHIEAFDGTNIARVLQNFLAYAPSFTGGVFVAAADLNRDGKADIVTGAGAGGGPHVEAFSGSDHSLLLSFFAYIPNFTGGVRVSVVPDVDGDGLPDIVTAVGPGGGPHTRVFRGATGAMLENFYVYDPSFLGGAYVGGA